MKFALTHGRIFTGDKIIHGHVVVVEGDRVSEVCTEKDLDTSIARVDLRGHLLAPGFIDVQVNGGADTLFNDSPDVEGIRRIGEVHRTHGTTGFLPTLISDSYSLMEKAIFAADSAIAKGVPGCLGVHLEGPYLNPDRKGVHPEKAIRLPDNDAFQLLSRNCRSRKTLVTLAPEKVPVGFIRKLVQAGVLVSAGHTGATYTQIRRAMSEGLTGFTHLFNAMTPMTSREPGVVGAALESSSTWCGLIVDGFHVHPATMKIAVAAKQRGGVMLVTDAVHSVGSQNDTFDLLGEVIKRSEGRVSTQAGTLAGSDLNMTLAVRNCHELLGLDLEECLRMASLYPANFLGLSSEYGKILGGYKASFVLLDESLTVQQTWIDGEEEQKEEGAATQASRV